MKRHARFCPRKKFLCRYRAAIRPSQINSRALSSSSFPLVPLLLRRRKRMSRFESRNARYASADINERGGGGGEEENGTFVPFVPRKTRNRKRTYRIENGLDSVSYGFLSLFLSPHGPPRAAIREEIDRFYIYIYLLLSSFLLPSLAIRLYNRYSYLGHERQPPLPLSSSSSSLSSRPDSSNIYSGR